MIGMVLIVWYVDPLGTISKLTCLQEFLLSNLKAHLQRGYSHCHCHSPDH